MPISRVGKGNVVVSQSLGAQILALAPRDVFYCSPILNGSEVCLRGGQPVLFPQFADRGELKKHGFVRDVDWHLESVTETVGCTELCYSLNISSEDRPDRPDWPYAAVLNLRIKLAANALTQQFEVLNAGDVGFSWTGGLHPYFRVADLSAASLTGLSGVSYEDRYSGVESSIGPLELRWDKEPCEKLFAAAPDLTLLSDVMSLKLSATGFDQWMIWNPGKRGAVDLNDLPDADWNKFVCIEPVCVSKPIALRPGECFTGKFEVSWASGVDPIWVLNTA